MIAVVGSMVIVADVTDSPLAPWAFAVLPLYALIAKTAGLYDRDNFVIHKTTLDEAPVLVAVVSIFTLFLQGCGPWSSRGARTCSCSGACSSRRWSACAARRASSPCA